MTFRSRVVGRVIPIPEDIRLPDGLTVVVEPEEEKPSRSSSKRTRWLLDHFPKHRAGISSSLRREEIYGDNGR